MKLNKMICNVSCLSEYFQCLTRRGILYYMQQCLESKYSTCTPIDVVELLERLVSEIFYIFFSIYLVWVRIHSWEYFVLYATMLGVKVLYLCCSSLFKSLILTNILYLFFHPTGVGSNPVREYFVRYATILARVVRMKHFTL